MNTLLQTMLSIKTLFLQLLELGFAFVAFVVLIYLLLGQDAGGFTLSVVTNLSLLVNQVPPNTLVAVALVLVLGMMLRARK